MEEKESIPENSTEAVSLGSGDKASDEKAALENTDSIKNVEDPQSSKLINNETNELGDDDTSKSENGNGQSENELISEKGDSELQNHVEHESDSVSDKVPRDVKEEINNGMSDFNILHLQTTSTFFSIFNSQSSLYSNVIKETDNIKLSLL